jgi:hypothetical protein
MLFVGHSKGGQNCSLETADRYFEIWQSSEKLEITVTSKNMIHEKLIASRV